MVATRSQDHEHHAPPTGSSHALSDVDISTPSSGKRRVSKRETPESTSGSARKKRKFDSSSSEFGGEVSGTLAAVVIPRPGHGGEDGKVEDGGLDKVASGEGIVGLSVQGSEGPPGNDGKGEVKDHEVAATQKQPTATSTTKIIPSPKNKTQKSRKRDPRMEVRSLVASPAHAPSLASEVDPPESQHKHFEDGIPEPISSIALARDISLEDVNTHGTIQDPEARSSDDEAPETVSQVTGLEKARSAAAEAAIAVNAQRAAEKEKRRERDKKMKSQAKGSKKAMGQVHSKNIQPQTPELDQPATQRSSASDQLNNHKWTIKDPLPALLPDELLAIEPAARLPTPMSEPITTKPSVNQKRRFLEKKTKPPKDIQRGNTRIRVLEERRAVLPPKISKSSQSVRESWLAGRLGAKGKMVMDRRKMGGGFIRGKTA
ncbi:MAG: hypothetical protein Q9219_000843 [cf. Caloplaca sp. 3 TL-2023]